ncbi:AraC family transcriptional regulator [Bradyrhizobium genosp. SA-3]|uniref:AraC family transcriptional regulator n=1 Tax=Bradyrhizobium genosp. SA-3 TaxID=508868 RepID=UPI00102A0C10|nr:AraC family transcriptional regulator [Bradyrhizobium genosp. SA-3]RZN10352.1 AraC family transcriptional regulator [Bradyrhizobium genosp. SA-3]
MRYETLGRARLPGQSAKIMASVLRDAGVDTGAVFVQAGVNPGILSHTNFEVTGIQELALQTAFARTTRCIPGAWLRAGLKYRSISYGPFGLVALAAATVDEALTALTKYQALSYSLLRYDLVEERGTTVALVANDTDAPEELREFMHERALGSVTNLLHDLLHPSFPLERIESVLDRPVGWLGCEAVLGAPVVFRASATRWVFRKGVGSMRLPMANSDLELTYRSWCNRLIEQGPGQERDLVAHVAEILLQSGQSLPSAAEVAAKLAISERTLYRRLADAGTSLTSLIDDARHRKASELLSRSSIPIEELAHRLGFSEASSFSRAFRRWSGLSPRQFRERH